ncbi:MAG: hypothetical protein ACE5HO_19025 [bacterium]
MKSIAFVLCFIVFCPHFGLGQDKDEDYPYPLNPGKSFRAPAHIDTLFWVLKSQQFDKFLRNTSELKNVKKQVNVLETKTTKLEQVIAKKDSTINDLNTGYERYKTKWEETQMKLEDDEVKILKLKRATFITGFAGIGVGLLIGALVF